MSFPFDNAYAGKRVLVTGHTGFKGAWLCSWLLRLGARVSGLSLDVPTQPALFEELRLVERMQHRLGDVRQLADVQAAIEQAQPDFVFHLAAQAIVSTSYSDPLGTFSTNVMGTATVLEALRQHVASSGRRCTAVFITSDKCYENVEWLYGYRETDAMGGKDPYSASKGAAELVFHAYTRSYAPRGGALRLASARAGNVIGGGDWARDRIVVDCMTSWAQGKPVEIRSPRATRPWQHVLEPLGGYLALGAALQRDDALHGESFNFGPDAAQNRNVLELLNDLARRWHWPEGRAPYTVTADLPFNEAGLLKLNCDKALALLRWQATLGYDECVEMVGDWYRSFYRDSAAEGSAQRAARVQAQTLADIERYERRAAQRGLRWALPAPAPQGAPALAVLKDAA